MPEPAACVMSMSADDDDRADQKQELADTGSVTDACIDNQY